MVAVLARGFRDLDVAEEATAEAFATAVEHWRAEGVPRNPGAWLTTTARRKALDRLRRDGRGQALLRLADPTESETGPAPDADGSRLGLLLLCCQPVLPQASQVALTLRMVGGLTVAEIASAFLVQEATIGQRISRAKATLRTAGLPFAEADIAAARPGVLAVIYLVFNEGYLASGRSQEPVRHDLVADAVHLARLLHAELPGDAEATGLLALILLANARRTTRVATDGALVPLRDQNRGAWDHAMIGEALRLIRSAARLGPPGRYITQAAISAEHARVDDAAETDWARIVGLYDRLLLIDPSPVVALNRAVAVAEVDGPGAAIALLDALAEPLAGYHPYFAVRADLLRRLGRQTEARAAYTRAIKLTSNTAEQRFLSRRRGELGGERPNPP